VRQRGLSITFYVTVAAAAANDAFSLMQNYGDAAADKQAALTTGWLGELAGKSLCTNDRHSKAIAI